jgi:Gene product 88
MDEDLKAVSRNKLAEQITGGLSVTSKMPCPSWSISAYRCRLGSVLAQKEGTTCSKCYARKGRYSFSKVQERLEQRYQALFDPLWTPAMIFLIRYYCHEYFRWFSSGDLQGENHLRNIVTVAEHTPDVRHWLPTRETEIVRAVGEFPENLVVRLSATKIDGKPPRWPTTSTVVTEGETCPASHQGGSCGNCRACWERSVANVAYRKH